MAEDAGEARVRDSSDVELPELPGSKRVSFAAGPEEPCRRSTSSLGGEFLTSSAGGVSEVQQMPYASVVVAWILVVAVVGGSAIHVVERGGRTGASWLDCCFVALNSSRALIPTIPANLIQFTLSKLPPRFSNIYLPRDHGL